MTPALIVIGLLAFVVGGEFFAHKVSGRPWWDPLWLAFTLTAVALVYGPAGLLGYSVPLENPFISHPAVWVGHVVWPQVALASALALISVLPWRQGLKRLRDSPR